MTYLILVAILARINISVKLNEKAMDMKCFKMVVLIVSMAGLFLFVGCKEAVDGADKIADQATGLTPLKKKKAMEDQLNKINEDHNKKIQEVLNKD